MLLERKSVGKEDQMLIDTMQFGLMPGKGTTGVIFIMRQVQEKHQEKKKKLYYAFVNLEEAFDRVPREVWISGSFAQLWYCI